MFAVAVTFQIAPSQLDQFLPLMLANAKASVTDEPGCHQFDVAQNPDTPATIFLYEVYDDEAAFKAHLGTSHFKSFDSATSAMIAEKVVNTYTVVSG